VTGVDDILDDPDDRRHVIVRLTVGGGYGSVTGAISAAAAPHSAGAVPSFDLDQDMTGDRSEVAGNAGEREVEVTLTLAGETRFGGSLRRSSRKTRQNKGLQRLVPGCRHLGLAWD